MAEILLEFLIAAIGVTLDGVNSHVLCADLDTVAGAVCWRMKPSPPGPDVKWLRRLCSDMGLDYDQLMRSGACV